MSILALPMSSPSSLKRSYDEAILDDIPGHTDQGHGAYATQAASHELSCTNEERSTSETQVDGLPQESSAPGQTMAGAKDETAQLSGTKRPKLTFADKEIKRIEKEFKEQQKSEERARKEEERLRKEEEKHRREEERLKKLEEKRVKDAEREAEKEEKRKAREEKERLKDEERQKKENERRERDEEKNKKARSQLSLNAFFGQPPAMRRDSTMSPGLGDAATVRRGSVDDSENQPISRSRSVSMTPQKPQISEYERTFPPFFLQTNTSLGPSNRFLGDDHVLVALCDRLDKILCSEQNPVLVGEPSIPHILHLSRSRRFVIKPSPSVKAIIEQMEGSCVRPVDLTDAKHDSDAATDLLRSVPMKFIKFYQDVRPPYYGTCTRLTDPFAIRKLSRKPFTRSLPETNYDYDSEAEWEEPGEGEDLNSEGEEDEEEEDDDEMEEFLDDDDVTDGRMVKRRPLLGDLESSCTGLCWDGASSNPDLSIYRIDMLTECPHLPIDPYSTAYWYQPSPAKPQTRLLPPNQSTLTELPRLPLHPISNIGNIPLTMKPPPSTSNQIQLSGTTQKPDSGSTKPVKRLIPPDLLEDFKKAINGNDSTKLGLIEMLKKKFPKQSKDVIKDTLDAVAERVGGKLAEKKWVLK